MRLSGNERPTGIWLLLAGQSGATLAAILRGVQRRDLARTRRLLPPDCGGGKGGRQGRVGRRDTLRARPHTTGQCAKSPPRTFSQRRSPICGMAGTRACLFRSKACHHAPLRKCTLACLDSSASAVATGGVHDGIDASHRGHAGGGELALRCGAKGFNGQTSIEPYRAFAASRSRI